MLRFFENIFAILARHDNHVAVVAVFIVVSAILIVLRVAAHVHFRAAILALYRVMKKEFKSKTDVEKIKNPLVKKMAVEYVRLGERAVTAVPTSRLAERAVSSLGFMGWRYDSLLPFIEAMEYGMLVIGLIFAVIFGDFAHVYGLLAVIVFVAFRVAAAFFNVRAAKARLTDELILFAEREIGRFYAADTGGALLRLKVDLTESLNRQADTYRITMESISMRMQETFSEVSASMVGAANSIGPIVASTIEEKILNMNENLKETLEAWADANIEAVKAQTAISASAERLSTASDRMQTASDLLATHMQGHSKALSGQMITLVDAINEMKSAYATLSSQQEILVKQTAYIEQNQRILEEALTSYEASLQSVTQSIGDGLGAFINLHAQTSAQTINEAMKVHIEKITNLIRV